MIPVDTKRLKSLLKKIVLVSLTLIMTAYVKLIEFKSYLFSKKIRLPVKITYFKEILGSSKGKRSIYGSLVVLVLSVGLFANSVNAAYVVEVNGKDVALVKGKEEVAGALGEVIKEQGKQYGEPVTTKDKITYKKTKAKKIELDGKSSLETKLAKNLKFYSQGVAIKINGQNRLILKNQAEAQAVLDKLGQSDLFSKAEVESVKFLEKVELAPKVETPTEEILTVHEAVEYIKNGGQKVEVYTVKEGDSLWTIARAHDMRVKELQAANPELRTEKLDISQVLKLVRVEPIINVESTLRVAFTQKIPYNIEYKKDTTVKNGQEKVKQKGSDGTRERTYQIVTRNGKELERQLLAEKVIKKPVTQVVLRGNKTVLWASRGGGSGNLLWPARGSITSGYGKRWGSTHTGIDIDGNTGDPVAAAESGRVTQAGRYYEYGNLITISHGNGLVTRYAHLSKISVSVGDQVSRGEIIGKVGSTGRSTGSHLHFETMVNGGFQNPIKFLR